MAWLGTWAAVPGTQLWISSSDGASSTRLAALLAAKSFADTAYRLLVTPTWQPVLTGELLLLRPMTDEDFEPLFRIASNPAVWDQHPSKDRAQEGVFRSWFDEALACRGALVARDQRTGEVIGTSRFVSRAEGEVEIGWTFLDPSRWGGLWNGEMKRLMLEYAFQSAQSVRFTVHSDNVRSQRAVERLGAIRFATEPDCQGRGENVLFRLPAPHPRHD